MRTPVIGIRREDKNRWEARVPLLPGAVEHLRREHGVEVVVQPSSIRAFDDEAYRAAGARIQEDLSPCDLVLAVKEIPSELFRKGGTYAFFSHTIKGQSFNMPMLRRLVEQRCNLVDYEKIEDDKGRRLVFFGWYAGAAGMIDTLAVLGQRLAWLGFPTPLSDIHPTWQYGDQPTAEANLRDLGTRLAVQGLPEALCPFVVGFAGYGNVSQGAQHMLDLLPCEEVAPGDLAALHESASPARDRIYKVVFHEHHLVAPRSHGAPFQLQEYYDHPDRYYSTFERYLPHLRVLVNGIYWTEDYPRLITRQWLREQAARPEQPRLLVVGDISCDIEGSIECTLEATQPDAPAYVYDPEEGIIRHGTAGPGLVVMAVDNLPCELPREASHAFSQALMPFLPQLAHTDFNRPTASLALPAPIARSLILHRGDFTPDYLFMQRFLD